MSISEIKRLSNQQNAQKSTGPRTPEGKAISRLNSTQHGFCSKPRCTPQEDPQEFDKRLEQWNDQLNPNNAPVQQWWVESVVHHTIIANRIQATIHARHVQQWHEMKESRQERKAQDVERLTKLLATQPDTAVRMLKRTVEGIDSMIPLWESLLVSAKSLEWDFNSLAQLHTLSGNVLIGDRTVRNTVINASEAELLDFMSPYWTATDNCVARQKICMKLFETQDASDWAKWKEYYNNDVKNRVEDERLRDEYEATARETSPKLVAHCQSQIDELTALRSQLIKDQAALGDPEDLNDHREAFDASEAGKLAQRYLHENLRAISKGTAEVLKLNKSTRAPMYGENLPTDLIGPTQVTPVPLRVGKVETGVSLSRNEPTEPGLTGPITPQELEEMQRIAAQNRRNDRQ